MTRRLNRRVALGLGAVGAAGVALGGGAVALADTSTPGPAAAGTGDDAAAPPSTPQQARERVRRVYEAETRRAKGTWNSYLSVAETDGTPKPAVSDKPDEVVEAYSVNKIAVATAVLDKVDRGLLKLDQRVDVTKDIIVPDGDGIFGLDSAYPSSVTLGHALAALLSISDDTAVRLSGLVCPAKELNEILVAKGFPKTQVVPVANPNRFFLGKTTPRETHDLLQKLVGGKLLKPASTEFLLKVLRSPIAFTDGIRRTMSSAERLRIATKAGWFEDGRNEAGIIFDAAGKPILTYSIFAHGQADADNFGATHPAVQARSIMGRKFLDAVNKLAGPPSALTRRTPEYHPHNGG